MSIDARIYLAAHAFIQALRSKAWHALPGYEAAAWGAPMTIAEWRQAFEDSRRQERLAR